MLNEYIMKLAQENNRMYLYNIGVHYKTNILI